MFSSRNCVSRAQHVCKVSLAAPSFVLLIMAGSCSSRYQYLDPEAPSWRVQVLALGSDAVRWRALVILLADPSQPFEGSARGSRHTMMGKVKEGW